MLEFPNSPKNWIFYAARNIRPGTIFKQKGTSCKKKKLHVNSTSNSSQRKYENPSFKCEFLILAVGQNWKLRNKKIWNNISEISKFSICRFFIFQKTFSLFYSRQFISMLCFVFEAFKSVFFLHQKYMFKILPCRTEIYLLWDVSIFMRTWGMLIWNSMKGFNLSHA